MGVNGAAGRSPGPKAVKPASVAIAVDYAMLTHEQAAVCAMRHERIDINPEVMGGKPVVRGTRIPVEMILRKLGAGLSTAEIIADHPRLTADDILAVQTFAADYLADQDVIFG
ncbi:hypothetical protein I8G32_02905 [Rhodopseudomonas palustris]|uniref:DUF433 n=2 Tax=Rhodopseudomonas palustris (strain ATCC BAA-98 / CGA009) TaxID=258594 RepID=Q6N5Z8_RHOPA|nr:hypothetical protein I8G32_02905 [Rhodopseudomonas palustris]RIA03821.1 DUF433 domain-containing protein [Rhodopseudomonas palustris]RJF66006.1 DUF433 domain-containing protein [Rhodopseudomonas palustris]CAE28262.1 DUF433 [Rhodopseudomonas palustris CGA009]